MPAPSVTPTSVRARLAAGPARHWRALPPTPVDEPALLAALLRERLDHAQAGQHFLEHRRDRAAKLLRLVPFRVQPSAEHANQHDEHRQYGECHEGEGAVQPRRDHDHPDEGHARREERRNAVGRDPLDGGRIVLDAVDRVGGAARVVIGERQALHVPEQAARNSSASLSPV